MAENTKHWDALAKTESQYTKKIQGKKFQGTDIKPAYRLRKMTEQFGPAGKGWGYEIQDRWKETLAAKSKGQDIQVECVFVMLRVWWSEDGGETKHYTGAQIGGTETAMAVDESYKMAITDALGKCLVDLGVCADVYLGEFGHDSKYSRQESAPKQENKQEPKSNGKQSKKPEDTKFAKGIAAVHKARETGDMEAITNIRAHAHKYYKAEQLTDGEFAKLLTEAYAAAAEFCDEQEIEHWINVYTADIPLLQESQAGRVNRAFQARTKDTENVVA